MTQETTNHSTGQQQQQQQQQPRFPIQLNLPNSIPTNHLNTQQQTNFIPNPRIHQQQPQQQQRPFIQQQQTFQRQVNPILPQQPFITGQQPPRNINPFQINTNNNRFLNGRPPIVLNIRSNIRNAPNLSFNRPITQPRQQIQPFRVPFPQPTYNEPVSVPKMTRERKPNQNFQPKKFGHWIQYQSNDFYDYYYNTKTKLTQWTKPDEIKDMKEECVWSEYKTGSGQICYFNIITSQTTDKKPKELIEYEKEHPKIVKETATTAKTVKETTAVNEPAVKETTAKETVKETTAAAATESWVKKASQTAKIQAKNDQIASENTSKTKNSKVKISEKEGEEQFLQLLKDKNFKSDVEWHQILQVIIYDPRYKCVSNLAKRKAIFKKFISDLKKMEAKQKKEKRKEQADAFWKCLKECHEINSESYYSEICDLIGEDPRFKAVERKTDRENIALDYVQMLRKKEKEHKHKVLRENAKILDDLIHKDSKVTYKLRWKDLEKYINSNNDYEDCLEKLDSSTIEKICRRYLNDLIRERRNKKDKEKEKKHLLEIEKQREREKRDKDQAKDFVSLLKELAEKGMLHAKSSFEEIKCLKMFKHDRRFKCFLVKNNDKNKKDEDNKENRESFAVSLFEDFCCDLEERLKEPKIILKKWLHDHRVVIHDTDNVEDLYETHYLNKKSDDETENNTSEFPIKSAYQTKLLFCEMIAKEIDRKREKEGKRRVKKENLSKKKKNSKKRDSFNKHDFEESKYENNRLLEFENHSYKTQHRKHKSKDENLKRKRTYYRSEKDQNSRSTSHSYHRFKTENNKRKRRKGHYSNVSLSSSRSIDKEKRRKPSISD